MSSLIPQKLRQALRRNSIMHGAYMRLKRRFTSQLVGMTSKAEQDFCTRYGREIYSGEGDVVDLGCWLGSTTITLARGLSENNAFVRAGRTVHAYDLFVWSDWMNESLAGTGISGRFAEGESFLAEFERRSARYSEHIEPHAGDLTKIRWNGGPIEFLLVDAMKNWDLTNAIIHDFYPYLIPGKSLVMHQDFAFWLVPWIHVLQWRLRDHFEIYDDIQGSTSLVFKLTSPIPVELLTEKYSYKRFSRQDLNSAYEYFLDRVSPAKRPNVAAAKVLWFLDQNDVSEAGKVLNDLIQQGIPLTDEMLAAREMLESRKSAAEDLVDRVL